MNLPFQNQNTTNVPLYGLVLAGGQSRRMGIDKATLRYHGKNQGEYCFELLSAHCEKVFISNRKEQASLKGHRKFPQIHDSFRDMGPLGGILSAMVAYPQVAWLVLACDLPYVDKEIIETLIKKRNSLKIATAYVNTTGRLPEPLCTIYESKSRSHLLKFLNQGCESPREILTSCDIQLLNPMNKCSLVNVNDPEEYKRAIEFLNQERKPSYECRA